MSYFSSNFHFFYESSVSQNSTGDFRWNRYRSSNTSSGIYLFIGMPPHWICIFFVHVLFLQFSPFFYESSINHPSPNSTGDLDDIDTEALRLQEASISLSACHPIEFVYFQFMLYFSSLVHCFMNHL
ncbi:unnamed protein product [Blepharisma stoltei]|uniref:Uncharacterized protein n=1 Tax=Blepharisma stoltei TaxID=1481888 RepID=A0AAU9JM55_9CILI|nr:unnamed protein product [Blepharisma stoltei]